MKLPVGLFTLLGRSGDKLYDYLYDFPALDVSLKLVESESMQLGPSYKKQNDIENESAENLQVYNFRTFCKIVISNNTSRKICNIKLLNTDSVFSSIEKTDDAVNLAHGESRETNAWFISNQVHTNQAGAKAYYFIHPNKNKQQLVVQYENTKKEIFYATLTLGAKHCVLEYSLVNPLISSK